MRLRHWLAFTTALCVAAATALAQPVIVDPTPDPEDETDWDLLLEDVPLDAPLASPMGMVFVGNKANEAMLVIEKNSGRVRHFANGSDQGDALDLGVDTCGDRGLLGIALHPSFDRATPNESDPENPAKDWVYLAYHTDAGQAAGDDGCDGDAELRVARYTWGGGVLSDPVTLYTGSVAAGETTEVGGVIATSVEFTLFPAPELVYVVYVAIGAQQRDGTLQNNRAAVFDLDDTSVLLRLRADDGSVAADNPFDTDGALVEPQDRYYAYGVRDTKGLTIDPSSGFLWGSEHSDAGFDEIDALFASSNQGFSPYQGIQTNVPKNLLDDGMPNPLYPLVDLAEMSQPPPDPPEPESTYQNPRFSFEAVGVEPTGVAFGGLEVGAQHGGSLFVGSGDGRLFRFQMERFFRQTFVLRGVLSDGTANLAVPDLPETTDVDESRPEDTLGSILIATGFGAISDLETGVDGSIYVLDRDNGTVHRVFVDALRDLAILRAKVPTKIKLSDKKPVVSKSARVTIVNNGAVAERIISPVELDALLEVEVTPLGACPVPVVDVVDPKYALPPYNYAIGIAPNGGRLDLEVSIEWACDNPSPKGEADFELRFELNVGAINVDDENPLDDHCPRPPLGDDPGCGAKGGGPFLTDIIRK